MANNTISPASLEARFERILMEVPLALQSGTMCLQLDGKKHENEVEEGQGVGGNDLLYGFDVT